nr:hypothetical protein [Bacteroidota bacterium]
NFYLNKWFLDFVGENSEAMIFYIATLYWNKLEVSYTSWLSYDPAGGVSHTSRFRKTNIPENKNGMITWNDSKFSVSGCWKPMTTPINTRLFDCQEGFIDWKCHQPVSKVTLKFKERTIRGMGYAEQLILTVPPWKISTDELRWGRFGSSENHMVWIELRGKEKRQWLWLNGEKIENCIIEDDYIFIAEKDISLRLDRDVILESEKKIFSVVESLVRYIPGINKFIPVRFLMADESKWLSKGILLNHDTIIAHGQVIHELVNFKPEAA